MKENENKKIINATSCEEDGIAFKSKLERVVYKLLLKQGFKPQYEPIEFMVWQGFTPLTPFYDVETERSHKKRVANGGVKNKLLELKKDKAIGIRYTPDFYFRYGVLDVYIEVKGFENDVFYIKKKLFRKYLDDKLIATGQHSIYFEVYTQRQLIQAMQIIKDYELKLSTAQPK